MQGLAVVLFPVLLMLFALAMERVEHRLSRLSVHEQDVAEFLETANPSEVSTLHRIGLPDALSRFHRRRQRAPQAATESELGGRRAS